MLILETQLEVCNIITLAKKYILNNYILDHVTWGGMGDSFYEVHQYFNTNCVINIDLRHFMLFSI